MANWLAPVLAATAVAGYQGLKAAPEQEARMTDLLHARQHDLSAPLPDLAVKQAAQPTLWQDVRKGALAGAGVGGAAGTLAGAATGHIMPGFATGNFKATPMQGMVHGAVGTGLGGAVLGGVTGGLIGGVQHARAALRRDPAQQVKAAHEAFTATKLAADALPAPPYAALPKMHDVATNAFANALSDVAIKQPLNALQGVIRKKLYTEPQQRKVLQGVLDSDPELAAYHIAHPEQGERTYRTLRHFAPGMVEDHNAVHGWLRNGMTTEGVVDWPSINMLSQIHKNMASSQPRP